MKIRSFVSPKGRGGEAFEIKLFSSLHLLPDTAFLLMENKEGNI
jgi:hypothetical protein